MAFSDSLQQIKNIDLSELDLESIGVWPVAVRSFLLILAFCLVLAGTYYFHIRDLDSKLSSAQKKEFKLKDKFEKKAFQAANLKIYRQQMVDVEKLFGALLAQLPSDTEVPGLLEDITELGSGSSLNILSITLQSERASEFYIELPIKIIAEGAYHDVGTFVSGIASLPRIVTLHDFKLSSIGNSGMQKFEIEARTYRYKAQDD